MRLLLDAHAVLWWLADDSTLAAEARAAIADPANDVYVSAATVWEIAIKQSIGKLDAPDDLSAALSAAGLVEVPVTGIDGERAASLAALQGDPFDRMLVAQAGRLDAVIVTRDAAFEGYGVPTIRA